MFVKSFHFNQFIYFFRDFSLQRTLLHFHGFDTFEKFIFSRTPLTKAKKKEAIMTRKAYPVIIFLSIVFFILPPSVDSTVKCFKERRMRGHFETKQSLLL
uniref:G_PROTEIN_RECEP_F1_2 domain-containing protein n=1 Tax=Caenorhabditis tropicalis TaxID=1561998 RepID=A0A1I7UKG9_9PELO